MVDFFDVFIFINFVCFNKLILKMLSWWIFKIIIIMLVIMWVVLLNKIFFKKLKLKFKLINVRESFKINKKVFRIFLLFLFKILK